MSEQEGLGATVACLVAAYEAGDVTHDVAETLHQLLPFSHYCCLAVCGPDDWLAATSNLLCPGPITVALWPKSESLAGLAAMLSRQLRSFQQVADQRLFDVEQFQMAHGPGALIATPLPGREGPPVRNAAGGYIPTALGALLVDLDLEPATPVDLRMRAHLRSLAAKLAPAMEAPGRATMERLCGAFFPAACLGGRLGAEVPPPKQPPPGRRRRGATCDDRKRLPGDDEADAPACAHSRPVNPFHEDAAAAFDELVCDGGEGLSELPVHSSRHPSRQVMDLNPISPALPPPRAAPPRAAAEGGAQPLQQPGSFLGRSSEGTASSMSSEDTARSRNGLMGQTSASPRLSSIEWPSGNDPASCQPQKGSSGTAAVSSNIAGSSTEQASDGEDAAATKARLQAKALAHGARQHPLWLSFTDKELERNFAAWHSLQLQKLDRAAISFATFIFAYLGFMPPHSLAAHAPVAYSATAALMVFLLGFAWIAHPWYLARRTQILKGFVLLYTVFNSQVGFPGVLDAMPGGDRPCTIPFVLRYINAQPLLTSCVVTMARLSIQAPIQALQLAISLGLPRRVCGACYAGRSPAACVATLHAQQLLIGFLAPLAIVYCVERRLRATFLSSQAKKLS